MRIVNAMFATGSGGIEQASLDYSSALRLKGHEVLGLAHPDADILDQLQNMDIDYITEKNRGKWDIFAVKRLRKHLHEWKPDIMIGHGNRAISLLRQCRYPAKLVGVCHNYKFKQLMTCDALISVSNDMRHKIIEQGYKSDHIKVVPNMIHLPNLTLSEAQKLDGPTVIGVAGRFVAKKGIDIFIRAIRILLDRQLSFRVVIAGAGEDDVMLRALARDLGLDEVIQFTGWFEDKESFYKSVDIFCVPSLHEPFGIVILEGFAYGLPVISSDAEGPLEIIEDHENGLLVAKGEPEPFADAIQELLMNNDLAQKVAKAGLSKVQTHYAMPVVASKLDSALVELCQK